MAMGQVDLPHETERIWTPSSYHVKKKKKITMEQKPKNVKADT